MPKKSKRRAKQTKRRIDKRAERLERLEEARPPAERLLKRIDQERRLRHRRSAPGW